MYRDQVEDWYLGLQYARSFTRPDLLVLRAPCYGFVAKPGNVAVASATSTCGLVSSNIVRIIGVIDAQAKNKPSVFLFKTRTGSIYAAHSHQQMHSSMDIDIANRGYSAFQVVYETCKVPFCEM